MSSENGQIGKVGIVRPADPMRLAAEGNTLVRADTPTTPVTNPQIVQGAIGAGHRLGVTLLDQVALPASVDVVDQDDVDHVGAEPLQTVLERAQRAVTAVVELDFER